jgi:hypothetical protein
MECRGSTRADECNAGSQSPRCKHPPLTLRTEEVVTQNGEHLVYMKTAITANAEKEHMGTAIPVNDCTSLPEATNQHASTTEAENTLSEREHVSSPGVPMTQNFEPNAGKSFTTPAQTQPNSADPVHSGVKVPDDEDMDNHNLICENGKLHTSLR